MKGKERFLAALENKKPDRLPCQVHSWMPYYLDTYLDGKNQFEAYEYFGMDPVIYLAPEYVFSEKDLSNWQIETIHIDAPVGERRWRNRITTPKGELSYVLAANQYTQWCTEFIIKDEKDFEKWNKYVPVPIKVNWDPVKKAKEKIGENGIVRSAYFDFGQCSPWQSFETMFGMERLIMTAMDNPEWLKYVLESLLEKKLRSIEVGGEFELDLVETGGGAGSSTVISPDMHKEFCLPYDKIQHEALHQAGTHVVYHLCGGLMPLLEIVVDNGADALETMTPKEMGGDCDLKLAHKKIGNKICFIGGFDQNSGFENGNPKLVRDMVYELFNSCPDGGYICSPSDHFFFGNPENISAFAYAAKECVY